MDINDSGSINMQEYVSFWKQVIDAGVPEKAVQAELQALLERLTLRTQINRISAPVNF